LIRLSVDTVLLINTRNLSIVIDKAIPLSIGISTVCPERVTKDKKGSTVSHLADGKGQHCLG
jgi:hypothetical protein